MADIICAYYFSPIILFWFLSRDLKILSAKISDKMGTISQHQVQMTDGSLELIRLLILSISLCLEDEVIGIRSSGAVTQSLKK